MASRVSGRQRKPTSRSLESAAQKDLRFNERCLGADALLGSTAAAASTAAQRGRERAAGAKQRWTPAENELVWARASSEDVPWPWWPATLKDYEDTPWHSRHAGGSKEYNCEFFGSGTEDDGVRATLPESDLQQYSRARDELCKRDPAGGGRWIPSQSSAAGAEELEPDYLNSFDLAVKMADRSVENPTEHDTCWEIFYKAKGSATRFSVLAQTALPRQQAAGCSPLSTAAAAATAAVLPTLRISHYLAACLSRFHQNRCIWGDSG